MRACEPAISQKILRGNQNTALFLSKEFREDLEFPEVLITLHIKKLELSFAVPTRFIASCEIVISPRYYALPHQIEK